MKNNNKYLNLHQNHLYRVTTVSLTPKCCDYTNKDNVVLIERFNLLFPWQKKQIARNVPIFIWCCFHFEITLTPRACVNLLNKLKKTAHNKAKRTVLVQSHYRALPPPVVHSWKHSFRHKNVFKEENKIAIIIIWLDKKMHQILWIVPPTQELLLRLLKNRVSPPSQCYCKLTLLRYKTT